MTAGMDDPVHVQVDVVIFGPVGVLLGPVYGDLDAIDFNRLDLCMYKKCEILHQLGSNTAGKGYGPPRRAGGFSRTCQTTIGKRPAHPLCRMCAVGYVCECVWLYVLQMRFA